MYKRTNRHASLRWLTLLYGCTQMAILNDNNALVYKIFHENFKQTKFKKEINPTNTVGTNKSLVIMLTILTKTCLQSLLGYDHKLQKKANCQLILSIFNFSININCPITNWLTTHISWLEDFAIINE